MVNLADEIAYNNHDVDDGVRSGLITVEQLWTLPLFRRCHDEALAQSPQLSSTGSRRLLHEVMRRMLSPCRPTTWCKAPRAALSHAAPADADAVRRAPPLVTFSAPMRSTCPS